jgi:hypothetical protein
MHADVYIPIYQTNPHTLLHVILVAIGRLSPEPSHPAPQQPV